MKRTDVAVNHIPKTRGMLSECHSISKSGNPYEPPTACEVDSVGLDRYELDGDVTGEDIARLIKVPVILHVLRGLCLLILVPMLAISAAIGVIDPGEKRLALPALAFVAVLGSVCGVAFAATTRSRRAKRLVRAQPNMVGPLRGEINSDGFFFVDQQDGFTHQITWPTFAEVVVNRYGMRFDWGVIGGNFVAVPARCIDGFEVHLSREMVERFRTADHGEPAHRCPVDFTNAPAHALRFEMPFQTGGWKREISPTAYYLLVASSFIVSSGG